MECEQAFITALATTPLNCNFVHATESFLRN